MAKIYMFLADGFETVEALAVADILRRVKDEVVIVAVSERKEIESAQKITVTADVLVGDNNFDDGDVVFLPGGMPGTRNLEENTICCNKIEPLWILGEMGLDGFGKKSDYQVGYRPDTGVKMHSTDGITYTADVYFWNTAGAATHNFGFCKKRTLASAADKWSEIAAYRIGAASGNTNITSGTT